MRRLFFVHNTTPEKAGAVTHHIIDCNLVARAIDAVAIDQPKRIGVQTTANHGAITDNQASGEIRVLVWAVTLHRAKSIANPKDDNSFAAQFGACGKGRFFGVDAIDQAPIFISCHSAATVSGAPETVRSRSMAKSLSSRNKNRPICMVNGLVRKDA